MLDPRIFERPITIFISYDNIFRDHDFFIIKKILDNPKLKKQFENYIDLSRFECQTDSRIQVMLLERNKKNIFEWLAIKEFDFEFNYNKFYDKEKMMFLLSPKLEMYNVIKRFIEEPFVEKIHIYGGPRNDKRKMFDLYKNLKDSPKISFSVGNFNEVLNDLFGINVIIDYDLDRLIPLIKNEEYHNVIFMVADYGYNYEINKKNNKNILKENIEEYVSKNEIYLNRFKPFKIKEEDLLDG